MIKSITLKNFQCHKYLHLEFDKNVTTIIGRNDKGKSSVIRSIRYLATNQPAGLSIIRRSKDKSTKETIARVEFRIDKHTIRRVRSKRLNAYYLDGSRRTAVGKCKVPDDIADIINIGEVNFQSQLAPPFWFLETAGQVSKNLNAIINLSSIDKTLENAAKKLRKSQSSVAVSEERLNEAKNSLKEIEWVKECDMDLNDVLMAKKRHSTLSDKRSRLSEMVNRIQSLTKRRKTLQRAAKEGRDVVKIGSEGAKCQEQVNILEQLLERLKRSVRLSSMAVPDMSDLLSAKMDCDKSAEDRRDLEHMVVQLKGAVEWRETIRQELLEEQKSLTKLIGKRCPVCGRKLEKEHIHKSSGSERPTGTYRVKPR